MNVEYLWAADCGICRGLKEQRVIYDIRRMLLPIPRVHLNGNPVGTVGDSRLALANGQVTQKSLMVGEGLQRFERRRSPDDDPLGTPMFHFVAGDDYEATYVVDLLGETETDALSTIEDKPWLCKRLLTKWLWRQYLSYGINAPARVKGQLRAGLEPDFKPNQYQLKGWQDAFRRAREVEF